MRAVSSIALMAHGGARESSPSTILAGSLRLSTTLHLGLALGLILVPARGFHEHLGTAGLYVVALIAGVSDVDAVTIPSAQLALGGLATNISIAAILIAVSANAVVKARIVTAMASDRAAFLSCLGLSAPPVVGAVIAAWSTVLPA